MTRAETFQLAKKTHYLGKKFFHITRCDSTQTYLKQLLLDGEAVGTAVIADQQTAGRGQHGKTWLDTGLSQLFCSFSLKINLPVQQLPIVNVITALSVVETLQNFFSVQDLHVKWPNDIYLRQYKLGGVISETFGRDKIIALIIGLGINFGGMRKELPEEIQETSSTLYDHGYDIDQIQFLNHFIYTVEQRTISPIEELVQWMQTAFDTLNMHQNKEIEILQGDTLLKGTARGIDKYGRLLLATENDDRVLVSSGHIKMNR
ncbi:MAG: biotin--[acetyl-CoA-carboxylase] ligase [Deltaproteobacteria bacterium]|nr:biotin--[acetyl-CoA-carboxylase] ligase [Deltaproteobacteria bacterium]